MSGAARVYLLLVGILWIGCAGAPSEQGAVAEANAADPALLPRPFTAEQIRDEWIPGLTMTIRRRTPDGASLLRWTVAGADAEGCDIEVVPLAADGTPLAEAQVVRSSWIELRDHASFPADRSRREPIRRVTPLGQLDGWLYTVRDDQEGTLTELFFVESLPGAPILARITRDGQLVSETVQITRERPESP